MTARIVLPVAGNEAHLEPTVAMLRGDQRLHQCGWCGTAVCVPATGPAKLPGSCPACEHPTASWWHQDGPSLAAFHLAGPDADDVAASRLAVDRWIADQTWTASGGSEPA